MHCTLHPPEIDCWDHIITAADAFVAMRIGTEPTGHDAHHSRRVATVAAMIARREGADPRVCQLAGLLHDVGDRKTGSYDDRQAVDCWLDACGVDAATLGRVKTILRTVAYHQIEPGETLSLEACCVHDADKLEWIGAIGIARTFAYGGRIGRMLYAPESDASSTIAHYRRNLLSIASLMHTRTGAVLAQDRQQFVIEFLERFDGEWATGTATVEPV